MMASVTLVAHDFKSLASLPPHLSLTPPTPPITETIILHVFLLDCGSAGKGRDSGLNQGGQVRGSRRACCGRGTAHALRPGTVGRQRAGAGTVRDAPGWAGPRGPCVCGHHPPGRALLSRAAAGGCGLRRWARVNCVFPFLSSAPNSSRAEKRPGSVRLRSKCFPVHLTTMSIIICES